MLSINIADVIGVLKTLQWYLIAIGVALVVAIAITVIVKNKDVNLRKFIRSQTWIAFIAILTIVVNMICFIPMSSMISLATGNGTISDETSEEAKDLVTKISEEGIVLLKNEEQTLPLEAGTKLNVFGWSSTNPVYGGTGSGALSDAFPTVSLLEGLTNAGFEVNQSLVDFYTAFRTDRPQVGMGGQDWTVPEPTQDEYATSGVYESAKEFSNAAVFVVSRSGGEGADLPRSYDGEDTFNPSGSMFGASGVRYSEYPDDIDASKHYLELTNREIATLNQITADYEDVVVVINSANPMELGFVDEYPEIKSVIYCPGVGQTGFNALGSIMAGTVNPSAKTIDTFVKDLTTTPNFNNFGTYTYENMDEFQVDNMFGPGGKSTPTFVNYTDSIYVGYKFYETAATEGLFNYDEVVQYPFGYGLSYTDFTQEMGEISVVDDQITFDVTVTNNGTVAGKDVVEVYFNPPYTNGGIEKATTNLVEFAKTGTLEPGASETVSIAFDIEEMASYDAKNAKAYVLDAGDYGISIRSDAHTIIEEEVYNLADQIVYNDGRESDELAATNQFDFAYGEGITYLSRADKFANYGAATAAPTNFNMPESQKATFMNNSNYDTTVYNNADDVMPTTGAKNGLVLADLRGLEYDDPQWDLLLDQMSVADMNSLISMGGYTTAAVSSIGKVMTVDCDGPASINNNFTKQGSVGFPAGVVIAATWNKELAYEFGQSIGKMADEMEVSGWYAPAMNMHRSAFAGRNFEYYSEDALLSGDMAANAIIGAEEYGVYAYIKHFAFNDQESSRTDMLCTWADEQALREIYLKPFEISVKDGGAKAVMSAFNYIGTEPAMSSTELLNTVLRDEWGFRGFVLTDYFGGYGYQNADRFIRGGTDIMLATYDSGVNTVKDQSATSVLAMRQASKNVLYTVVNSRAYASDVDTGLLNWQIAAIVIDLLILGGLVYLEMGTIKRYRKNINVA